MINILKNNLSGTYGTLYCVKDMRKAVEWYKALGLTPTYESEEWTEFPINGHSLCLHITDPAEQKASSGILILHVNNIQEVINELKQNQVTIVHDINEIFPGAGAYSAKIADLDGNIISLYQGPKYC